MARRLVAQDIHLDCVGVDGALQRPFCRLADGLALLVLGCWKGPFPSVAELAEEKYACVESTPWGGDVTIFSCLYLRLVGGWVTQEVGIQHGFATRAQLLKLAGVMPIIRLVFLKFPLFVVCIPLG